MKSVEICERFIKVLEDAKANPPQKEMSLFELLEEKDKELSELFMTHFKLARDNGFDITHGDFDQIMALVIMQNDGMQEKETGVLH